MHGLCNVGRINSLPLAGLELNAGEMEFQIVCVSCCVLVIACVHSRLFPHHFCHGSLSLGTRLRVSKYPFHVFELCVIFRQYFGDQYIRYFIH